MLRPSLTLIFGFFSVTGLCLAGSFLAGAGGGFSGLALGVGTAFTALAVQVGR
jgi:hypothetical protein